MPSEPTKKPEWMSDIEFAVLTEYQNGEFLYLAAETDRPSYEAAARKCGDTLLTATLIELSEGEDCDKFDIAVARLNTMIDDLAKLREAFEQNHI